MLNTRLLIILQELMAANGPVTSDFLSKKLQVTSRTVRNDIKELDSTLSDYGASITSIRGTGYALFIKEESLFRSYLKEILKNNHAKFGAIPNSSYERVVYIIRRLLLSDNNIKLDDLATELYVSKSTIQNDLREVKKALFPFEITLDTRSNSGIKVKGEELKLRFCMSEFLFSHRQFEKDIIAERIFPLNTEEIFVIRKIILHQINELDINLSDIGFNNLIIHVAIACVRIKNGNYVSLFSKEIKDIMKEPEFEVAKNIVKQIEDHLDIIFPPSEIAYITIHLLGNKIISEPLTPESLEEMKHIFDEDVYHLTLKILKRIEEHLHLEIIHDRELLIGIALHLKPAINRHIYSMNMRNPMIEQIKHNFPLAFEAGLLASKVIQEELEIEINENEIGYLALHIEAAMERHRMNHEVKRCMIVCASGVGSAAFLKYKLKAEFGPKLEIVGTTEYYKLKDIPFHKLDFVISTIPINETLPVPVIEVDVLLGKADFEQIAQVLKGE